MPDPWISRKEAARRLGCDPSTLAGMIRRGEVKAAPLPAGATRRVRREPSIDAESVELLLQRREVERTRALEREAERVARRSPPDDGQAWLTMTETAVLVGLSRTRIRQRIDAGRIPATRHGDRWWIRRQDAEVVANARRFRETYATARASSTPTSGEQSLTEHPPRGGAANAVPR